MHRAPSPEELSSTYLLTQAGAIKVKSCSLRCHIRAHPCVVNEFFNTSFTMKRGLCVDHVAPAQNPGMKSDFFTFSSFRTLTDWHSALGIPETTWCVIYETHSVREIYVSSQFITVRAGLGLR